jgi:hypothetical protein
MKKGDRVLHNAQARDGKFWTETPALYGTVLGFDRNGLVIVDWDDKKEREPLPDTVLAVQNPLPNGMTRSEYSGIRKAMIALVARGWSCPGRGKDVVNGAIPEEGWQSPDGREGIKLMDAFAEESR